MSKNGCFGQLLLLVSQHTLPCQSCVSVLTFTTPELFAASRVLVRGFQHTALMNCVASGVAGAAVPPAHTGFAEKSWVAMGRDMDL